MASLFAPTGVTICFGQPDDVQLNRQEDSRSFARFILLICHNLVRFDCPTQLRNHHQTNLNGRANPIASSLRRFFNQQQKNEMKPTTGKFRRQPFIICFQLDTKENKLACASLYLCLFVSVCD